MHANGILLSGLNVVSLIYEKNIGIILILSWVLIFVG